MYKYSCRKCPIRNRCIDESKNADSIKVMIRRAFEARTDTLATWGRLQRNCLLIQAEERKRKAGTSPLSLRLQQVKGLSQEEADKKPAAATKKHPDPPPTQTTVRRIRPKTNLGQENHSPDYLQPVAPKAKKPVRQLRRLSTGPLKSKGPQLYWFTIEATKRRITLPLKGGLTFGRFDPNVGIPPDVDLSYEDRSIQLISRRHASLLAENGKHIIEDLGSKSGLFLNGEKVDSGPSRPLEQGDTVWLGRIQFKYEAISRDTLRQAKTPKANHTITVTPTGRKISVDPSKNVLIGRADSRVDFVPDIDLSQDGEAARLVSRRHALIQWRFGQPYLEDLGSGFGTRLRGELLTLGQAIPLIPGDHIWLAGCVLAYDIDV